jgi:hypothetical protein
MLPVAVAVAAGLFTRIQTVVGGLRGLAVVAVQVAVQVA